MHKTQRREERGQPWKVAGKPCAVRSVFCDPAIVSTGLLLQLIVLQRTAHGACLLLPDDQPVNGYGRGDTRSANWKFKKLMTNGVFGGADIPVCQDGQACHVSCQIR